MDTNYKHPIESFYTYNKNQTPLGEHAHEKCMGRFPNQVVRNKANSSGNGPPHMKNIEKY